MTLRELAEVLRQTVIMSTPLDEGHVILAKQKAPRPSGPYASIDAALTTGVGWGYKNYSPNVDDLDEKNTQLAVSQVSVQFMREFAHDYVLLLNGALTSQDIIDYWNSENVAFVEKSGMREISSVISASFEERFQMDVSVMFEHDFVVQVPGIDSARVIGEIDNGSAVIADIDIQT